MILDPRHEVVLRQMTPIWRHTRLPRHFRGTNDLDTRFSFTVVPMDDIDATPQNEQRGDGRHAARLVGRESEMDCIRAFVTAARTDGGALLVIGNR